MRTIELRPYWNRGLGWWDGRSAREQLMLGALAAVALLALLLVLVAKPLASERAKAVADIRSYDMVALRLRAAGPSIGGGVRRGPPASLVSQSAAAAGLTVQRIGPEGARLSVVFGDSAFENILRFVSDLETNTGLRISEARIERSSNGGGLVSAQFLLAGG